MTGVALLSGNSCDACCARADTNPAESDSAVPLAERKNHEMMSNVNTSGQNVDFSSFVCSFKTIIFLKNLRMDAY